MSDLHNAIYQKTNDTSDLELANNLSGGGSSKIIVETPTVTNATPYKYTGSALGPTVTWASSAMANYVNITNATGTAVGQYVLTLALKNPTLSMWDDLTTSDKTYNYDIIPDGATATANNAQTLLKCADIFDKDYTTISQVLADSSSLTRIISSENAIDYLVRSTSWATDVCSDSGAMGLIGLNNYASNTLLDDNTWCTAICNSSYFENVLNAKVPILSSNQGPDGGTVIIDSQHTPQSGNEPYKAFDGDDTSFFAVSGSAVKMTDIICGYTFTSIRKMYISKVNLGTWLSSSYKYRIQGVKDGSVKDLITQKSISVGGEFKDIFTQNIDDYDTYRIYFDESVATESRVAHPLLYTLQFYGREDV